MFMFIGFPIPVSGSAPEPFFIFCKRILMHVASCCVLTLFPLLSLRASEDDRNFMSHVSFFLNQVAAAPGDDFHNVPYIFYDRTCVCKRTEVDLQSMTRSTIEHVQSSLHNDLLSHKQINHTPLVCDPVHWSFLKFLIV